MGTVAEATRSLDGFDLDLVEHFKCIKNALVDNENTFGPNSEILSVQEQIGHLRQLRQSYRGPDRQELLHIQVQFADLCGWLYRDSGDCHAAAYWSGRALEWAHMCGDHWGISIILARKSHLAADMGDSLDAVDAAEAALSMVPHASGCVAIIATTFAAQALGGGKNNCEHSYVMAHELIDRAEQGPACPWALRMVDHSYIEVYRARNLTVLGEYGAAIESFRKPSRFCLAATAGIAVCISRERSGSPPGSWRCGAGFRGRFAGRRHWRRDRSARIMGGLKHLDGTMRRFPTSASAANFREAMHSAFSPSELRGVPHP